MTDLCTLSAALTERGFAFVEAPWMHAVLATAGDLSDWPAFAASWNDLALDTHMADRGRYRRRRHAVFALAAGGDLRREPHQPHYQSLEYNPLNGGLSRWFEPIDTAIGGSASLHTILGFCGDLFGPLAPAVRRWRIEIHQFRIEAHADVPGQPTPEGVHRDGVDFVFVLLVRRHNIASGVTTIHAPDRRLLGSFTLTEPFDAALFDDARVYHGVTPVCPLEATGEAHRDVLVITFRCDTE